MANGNQPGQGDQLDFLALAEQASSVMSILGCAVVIATFSMSSEFRKPTNRLVLFACAGHLMANVGTMMGRHFIASPYSAGCRIQAFLIQMYLLTAPSAL